MASKFEGFKATSAPFGRGRITVDRTADKDEHTYTAADIVSLVKQALSADPVYVVSDPAVLETLSADATKKALAQLKAIELYLQAQLTAVQKCITNVNTKLLEESK